MHPTQPDWLLAKVRRMECEEAGSATNPWCAFDLFVSQARTSAPPAAPPVARACVCRGMLNAEPRAGLCQELDQLDGQLGGGGDIVLGL